MKMSCRVAVSSKSQLGEIYFQALMADGCTQSLVGCWAGGLQFLTLLARGYPQLLTMWPSP